MNLYKKHTLTVYNSLSRSKQTFEPINQGKVGMYVCGPTVYSNVHLGNVRTFISFDIIFRYLRHLGYKVRYVRNITDVGHLENDADNTEDKVLRKARIEKLEPMEVVQKYTLNFHHILALFNNLPPSIEPTATGHIMEQIQIVEDLLKKGIAYEVEGSVYFDVLKYNANVNYGILSGRNIEQAIHNTRELDGQIQKKNPQDFALWKKANIEHIMRWQSPWGEGFPGWHLECTAMSHKYLGNQFDIHGGGIDLKFPHHECEIAQTTAYTGKMMIKYWMHANMLTLNGQKMSKSTGNYILPSQLFSGDSLHLNKGYSPAVVRFFMMHAHYRNVLDFSDAALQSAERGFNKLMQAVELLKTITPCDDEKNYWDVNNWVQRCYNAMNDDFNTPILVAYLFEAVKQIHLLKEKKIHLTRTNLKIFIAALETFTFDVLGLQRENNHQNNNEVLDRLSGVIGLLIELREQARADKNWELSDQIRDKLLDLGIQLRDGKKSATFSII